MGGGKGYNASTVWGKICREGSPALANFKRTLLFSLLPTLSPIRSLVCVPLISLETKRRKCNRDEGTRSQLSLSVFSSLAG